MQNRLLSVIQDRILMKQIGVLALVATILMLTGILYPSTAMATLLIFLLAVMNPRVRAFAVDFAPFIILLFVYNGLRNFANQITTATVHVEDLIRWERALGGGSLPTYWMQQHLWGHFYTPVLDVITNTLYLGHFLTPIIASVLLWRHRRSDYWSFVAGLLVLSFAGFTTYILFPAAPPWWATRHGYLVTTPITLKHFLFSTDVVSAGPNPVAAMPSLHTAYPTYIALVFIAVWGRKALPMLVLPLMVAFSTFYLGHHWMIDSIAGAFYATVVFTVVFRWFWHREFTLDWLARSKSETSKGQV